MPRPDFESRLEGYLDGDLNEAGIAALLHEVQEDPEAASRLESSVRLQMLLAAAHGDAGVETRMLRRVASRLQQPKAAPPFAWRWWAAAAAAVILVCAVLWPIFLKPKPPSLAIHVVESGQVTAETRVTADKLLDGESFRIGGTTPAIIRLHDGSRVKLDPGSEGVFRGPIQATRQTFSLKQGKALFQVSRGNGQFRVETTLGRVVVLGTEFSVALGPVDQAQAMSNLGVSDMTTRTKAVMALTVAVIAGHVQVDIGDRGYNLFAGQRVYAAAQDESVVSAADLNLTPTELVLVDGRKIEGQLVCEMDKHLVLYSPSLGTTASFEKRFISTYARDKQPVKLNEPRMLSAAESRYINWNGWADAAPKDGPVPAYAKEKWAKPRRLLVWARPGESGDFSKAESWLAFGATPTGKEWWDAETDILLPSSPTRYKLVPGDHPELPEGRMTFAVRHITAERGSTIMSEGCRVFGNEWVRLGGRINMRFLNGWLGNKHTFARVDAMMPYRLGVTADDIMWGLWQGVDKERVRPETEQDICQYLTVEKDDNASVEFLGQIASRDKIQIMKGTAIAGPDSQVMSDNRNGDHVHPGATLVLLDGAIWGKRCSFCRPDSIDVQGTLLAGTPDRPLKRDVTLLTNKKDYTSLMGGNERRDAAGLRISKTGKMRIYSSDPTKARLIIRNGRCDTGPGPLDAGWDPGHLGERMNRWLALPQYTDVVLLGDVVLDGVVFEDLWKGGLRLADLKQKDSWRHITLAPSCQSQKPEDVYAVYQKDTPPSGWTEDPAVKDPPPPKEPEPACQGNAEVAKARQAVKDAERRFEQAKAAYKRIKDDDEKIVEGMVAAGQARWELWQAERAKWLAILAAQAQAKGANQ